MLGIGNPGAEYEATRHNCGFMVLDELARRHRLESWQKKWNALVCSWSNPSEDIDKVLLVKPLTRVNGSGEVVQAVMAFYQLAPADVLVIVDDINLELGHLRLRASGSAGGHNGLKDIEERIGQVYPRLRMGIGKPPSAEQQADYVLDRFTPDETAAATAMVAKAADCAEAWLRQGTEIACRFNGPLK
jgi:PTH1 family peptidyl-tRNA hydrolase